MGRYNKETEVSTPFGNDWLHVRVNQIEEELAPHRVPMKQRVDEANDALFQTQQQISLQVEKANRKTEEERERTLKLIEESNTFPGVWDPWHKIHGVMNARPIYSKYTDGRIPDFLDEIVEQEMRDYRKVNPRKSRPGYGYKRSKTRAQIQPNVDEAAEKWRKKRERQTTFLHLLNKK